VSTLAVLGAGVLAIVWGATHRASARARRSPARTEGLAVWAFLAALLVGWQLLAFLQHPRFDHPTLSSIADAVFEVHVVEALAFMGWLVGALAIGRR
jgi:hypothetical protein